jgi:glutamyl-tRNA reductase
VVEWDAIGSVVGGVDAIVTATGASRPVIDAALLENRPQELLICDLAVPRDVAPEVGSLPGVSLVDIETLKKRGDTTRGDQYLALAEAILVEEVETFAGEARAAGVAPTVAALRTRAEEVVDAELSRLRRRTPDLSDDQRAEVAHTLHRVVNRLLHQPTVRVRQMAAEPGGEDYARVLRELFALDAPELSSFNGAAEALRISPGETGARD